MKNQSFIKLAILCLVVSTGLKAGGRGGSKNTRNNVFTQTPVKQDSAVLTGASQAIAKTASTNVAPSTGPKTTTPSAGNVDFAEIQVLLTKAQTAKSQVTFPTAQDTNIQGFYTNNPPITLSNFRDLLTQISKSQNYKEWIKVQANKDIFVPLIMAAWPKDYCKSKFLFFTMDARPDFVQDLVK